MGTSYETLLTPETIERNEALGYWDGRILTDHFDDAVRRDPRAVSSVDSRGKLTYGELDALVSRCAQGLVAHGIGKGDVVSLQLPNWNEWIVLHLAAVRIGAVTNPLIPIYRDREISYMVEKARTALLVVPDTFRGYDHLALARRVAEQQEDPATITVIGSDPQAPAELREGELSWSEFIATEWENRAEAVDLAALRPDPNDVALLMFTSGTTGRPKGVMHSHHSVCAAGLPWSDRMGMDHRDVIHMASTFGHLTGFLFGVELPILLGAKGVFQDVWNKEAFVELVAEHGVTHTSGATPFLHDLLHATNLAEHDVSSLQRFCCMGAPIPRVLLRDAREAIPGLSVLGGWGQTECALSTCGSPSDPVEKITTTDGRPVRGIEVRITDLDGAVLPAGEQGKLWVKGPSLFLGYLDQLAESRRDFDGDWFDTGDLASLDEDGYLTIAGRSKDLIIRSGENIPVAYLENVLHEHPGVASAVVVGTPHERLQEIACAVLVMNDGAEPLTLESLREFLETKGVAKSYWPERVEIREDLPRTPSGKIQKYQIRHQLGEGQS